MREKVVAHEHAQMPRVVVKHTCLKLLGTSAFVSRRRFSSNIYYHQPSWIQTNIFPPHPTHHSSPFPQSNAYWRKILILAPTSTSTTNTITQRQQQPNIKKTWQFTHQNIKIYIFNTEIWQILLNPTCEQSLWTFLHLKTEVSKIQALCWEKT